jgi:hypothetical protein
LIVVDVLYTWCQNKYNKYFLNKIVEKGTRPEIDFPEDEFASRSLIIDHLKKILKPNINQSHYYVICEEHRTGKTTLVRTALREVGQGVIYVNIPANFNDLGEVFRKAFKKQISITEQLGRRNLGKSNKLEYFNFC